MITKLRRYLVAALILVTVLACTPLGALASSADTRTFVFDNGGKQAVAAETIEVLNKQVGAGEFISVHYDNGAVVRDDDVVGTGYTVTVWKATSEGPALVETGTLVVKGDLTGSGKTSLQQLVTMARALAHTLDLSPTAFQAADLNNSGSLDLSDLVRMVAYMNSAASSDSVELTPAAAEDLYSLIWCLYVANFNDGNFRVPQSADELYNVLHILTRQGSESLIRRLGLYEAPNPPEAVLKKAEQMIGGGKAYMASTVTNVISAIYGEDACRPSSFFDSDGNSIDSGLICFVDGYYLMNPVAWYEKVYLMSEHRGSTIERFAFNQPYSFSYWYELYRDTIDESVAFRLLPNPDSPLKYAVRSLIN